MRFLKFMIPVMAMLGMPNVAQAGTFKPAGPWAADYGDDYCDLGRVFTDGKSQITLMLERTQPGAGLRLILIGEGIRPFRGAATWTAQFGPSGPSWKARILQTKTGDGTQYYDLGVTTVTPMAPPVPGQPPVFKPYNRGEERTAAKPLNAFELGEGLVEPVRFETGSLDAPIGALQTCVSDLVASWGLDAAKHDTMTRPAMPAAPAHSWIPTNNYPFGEFQKLQGGRNTLKVVVDAEGKPTSCVVQRPTVAEAMNKAACDGIVKNGKFTPALDSAGQAMASYWITEVFGLMPPMGGPR